MVLSAVITCKFIPAAKNSGKTNCHFICEETEAVTTRRAENLKAFYWFGITFNHTSQCTARPQFLASKLSLIFILPHLGMW